MSRDIHYCDCGSEIFHEMEECAQCLSIATPNTDAQEKTYYPKQIVPSSFARSLERQRNKAINKLAEAIDNYRRMAREVAKLETRLGTVEKERDSLASKIDQIANLQRYDYAVAVDGEYVDEWVDKSPTGDYLVWDHVEKILKS